MAMGPEAALLSARLAEIRGRDDLDRPIYVEAAGKARHTELWVPTQRPGFWARLRARDGGQALPLARGPRKGVPAAALPAMQMGERPRRRAEPEASLAALPACRDARPYRGPDGRRRARTRARER